MKKDQAMLYFTSCHNQNNS